MSKPPTVEEIFERELDHYRRETDAAVQLLYAWIAFHACLHKNKKARMAANENPFYWNTVNAALQTSLFIALGRIFDNDPRSHTLARLISIAHTNSTIFSKAALARRKVKQGLSQAGADVYVEDTYVPTEADFRRMKAFAARKMQIYRKAYSKIRSKIYAHSDAITPEQSEALFAQTRLHEMQRLVVSLREFHESLWQLYVNGRAPKARRRPYTIGALRKIAARGDKHVKSAQEKVVEEAYRVLESLKP